MKLSYRIAILIFTITMVLYLDVNGQNVGVGTTSPEYKLDIDGRARLRHAEGLSAGLWFNRTDNTVSTFAGMQTDTIWALGSPNGWKFLFDTYNGKLGIGNVVTAQYPLAFKSVIGDKISLYGGDGVANANHYGFGIQGSLMQLFTSVSAADIAFGYGRSGAFTETMRIKGTGNVGIGISTPLFKLDVRNGSINTDSLYRIRNVVVLSTKGIANTFVGGDAGQVNSGSSNTFSGFQSGYFNTSGYSNSYFGTYAGYANNEGRYNSFFGELSGRFTQGGELNSFFGRVAGYKNTSGSSNSFFGESAGFNNMTGAQNAFVGRNAGFWNDAGNFNTAIGYDALRTNVSGSQNTALGNNADVNTETLSNATAIGAKAQVDCSNCMVLGSVNGINGGTSNINVGIGNNNPTLPLSFGSGLGDKIALYGNATANYGFGVQGALLQIHTDVMASDIAFGYGSSTSFTEKMRIKGTGNVGIGIANPLFKLDVRNGSINTDSVYRIENIIMLSAKGANNTFVGKYAGKINSGINNCFVGTLSGYFNTMGEENSFFGSAAGYYNNTGEGNSFFGRYSGFINETGNFNTAIGFEAMSNNTTGSENTVVGSQAEVNSTGLLNATALGANARVDCSNCMVLGSVNGINGGTSNINVGIGNNNPALPLSFGSVLGDKISLYGNASSNYGFGVQGALLQIHADVMASDIAFGYGSSTSFTENVRIKGNGFVGIGTNAPGYILDVDGRMRIRSGGTNGTSAGLWLNNNANNTSLAFFGMENDSYAGMYCAAGFQFKMNVTNGNVAIGAADPTEKLTVHGNIRANGNICYTGTNGACSDIRYKTKLSPLTNSLSKVLSLQGLYYFWRKDEFAEKEFSDERQIGFAAQEIEKLFPEIVQTDASGYKAVDYGRLTPVLVEAIKEQQDQIEKLKGRILNIEIENDQLKESLVTLESTAKESQMNFVERLNRLEVLLEKEIAHLSGTTQTHDK